MTQPADPSFTAWLLEHLWVPAIALIGVVWRLLLSIIKSQGKAASDALMAHAASASAALEAHAKDDERQFRNLHEELMLQRSHIGKLFDKLDAHARRSEDRHAEVLTTMNRGLRDNARR